MFWLQSARMVNTAHHKNLILRRSFGNYSLTTPDNTQLSGWFIIAMWKYALAKFRSQNVDMRHSLVFGVALGDVVRLLLKKPEVQRVVGIDYDPELFALGNTISKASLDPRFELIGGSAEGVIKTLSEKFSFVIIDLFSNRFPAPCVSSEEFQLNVRDHLTPGGAVAVNCYETTEVLEGWRKHFDEICTVKFRCNTIVIFQRRG